MIIGKIKSKNNVHIRLTSERWLHITTSHPEINSENSDIIFNDIHDPDIILRGDEKELLAVKKKVRSKFWFVVIYKEVNKKDGFVITAYKTTDIKWLLKRKALWSKR